MPFGQQPRKLNAPSRMFVCPQDNRLQSGDHILQIGDVNLRGMGSEQVAAVLRQSGTHVRLVVARPVEPTSPDYQVCIRNSAFAIAINHARYRFALYLFRAVERASVASIIRQLHTWSVMSSLSFAPFFLQYSEIQIIRTLGTIIIKNVLYAIFIYQICFNQ